MKIAFAANRGLGLWRSRRELISHLLRSGHEVSLLTARDSYAEKFVAMGASLMPVNFHRGAFAPCGDPLALLQMVRHYRRYRPHFVHHFHAKPMMFGALAARLSSHPRILNTVTGLGESLPDKGLQRFFSLRGYRSACAVADATIFQNSEDQQLFVRHGLVKEERSHLICSSGVDVFRFCPAEAAAGGHVPRVLMMARLLHQKGVKEFIEAARQVQRRHIGRVRFELAGEWDPGHPDALDEAELQSLNHDGTIIFLGYCSDPQVWLQGALAFVCPSYYREGVPRVVLEASASGVPVIGSDMPGVREAIVDGETGFLVPARSAEDIADRVCQLLTEPSLAAALGRAARVRMETAFDIRLILRKYLDLYGELGMATQPYGDLDAE